MTLLRLISFQYVRKHKLRWLLTLAGIVLGVAVFVGMHTANQSVLRAFHQTIDRIAGTTQLQVSAGEAGFPEEALETVQNSPDIRVAVPVIEASVNPGRGNLLLLGVDMTGDRSLRDYDLENNNDDAIDDPLVFLAQPDSLLVTRIFANAYGLKIGDKLPMATMAGPRDFVVRGIMQSGGLASAFGGNLAVMDIYAAQKLLGRGRRFDRIDIAVREGVRVEDAQANLQKLLGTGYLVESPGARGQQFESTAQIYSLVSSITSMFALFVGMFLIYNTFEIAVSQRRSEIGILRALGATRSQIRTLFLGESVVAGLVGSVLGIAFGLLLARGIAAYVGTMLSEVYGVAQNVEDVAAEPWLLAAALFVGTLTSVLAALIPARDASRVDPVKALQKGKLQLIGQGENMRRRIGAIVLFALALGCMSMSYIRPLFYLGYLLAIMAAVLFAPTACNWVTRTLRPLMKWLRPVEGALAADSLIESPRRTSGTVTALMLSLALVIALGGVARSSYKSIQDWLVIALSPDLFVTTNESLTSRSFVFPPEIGDGIATIPGIDLVQMVRTVRINVRNTPVMLVCTDIASVARKIHLPPREGDPDTMYQEAAKGKGVIVSDNFALLRKYKLGDIIELPAPDGPLRMPILGIVIDYSDQQGSILLDRELYIKHWKDTTVNVFRVYLQNPTFEPSVRAKIQEMYGGRTRLFVFTNQDLRAYILKLTDQWFGLTYVQIAVAVLVAILGIVNTLTVSISDRKRELGVLQAVGGLRNQIRGTIWMEALAIGFTGLVLGLVVGAIQLYYTLEISRTDVAGLRLDYQYPINIAAVLLPVILGAAWISALGPAESAVRGSLVEALEYE
ncbi:permease [Bryobacterales bacterium F-183]|nr:permease [Bryobacterales bacterium F-183]